MDVYLKYTILKYGRKIICMYVCMYRALIVRARWGSNKDKKDKKEEEEKEEERGGGEGAPRVKESKGW